MLAHALQKSSEKYYKDLIIFTQVKSLFSNLLFFAFYITFLLAQVL